MSPTDPKPQRGGMLFDIAGDAHRGWVGRGLHAAPPELRVVVPAPTELRGRSSSLARGTQEISGLNAHQVLDDHLVEGLIVSIGNQFLGGLFVEAARLF